MEITALHHVSPQKPQGREFLFPGTSPFSVLCSILAQNSCTRMLKPDLSTFAPDESCSLPAEQGLLTGAVLTCPPCLLLKVSLSFKGYFPLHMQRSIMDLAVSLGGIVSFLSCLHVAQLLSWMHSEAVESGLRLNWCAWSKFCKLYLLHNYKSVWS